jgi:hypothetical protein
MKNEYYGLKAVNAELRGAGLFAASLLSDLLCIFDICICPMSRANPNFSAFSTFLILQIIPKELPNY